MHYFAGLFDAEGWVSLIQSGHFIIGLEVAHEQTVISLNDHFGGKIYKPTRKERKQVFSWRISTNTDAARNFITQIEPYSIIKKQQLISLKSYLDHPRIERRDKRSDFVHTIAELKKPKVYTRNDLTVQQTIAPDSDFFEWFAGFMDGDGNFCIYEYEQANKRRTFDSYIGIYNIFADPLIYVNERIQGSISKLKGAKFPVWKWICSQANSALVCDNLMPNLIIKKEQCRLVSQYLKIHDTKIRGIDHPDHVITEIRDIIKQIKHHNSL